MKQIDRSAVTIKRIEALLKNVERIIKGKKS